MQFFHFDAPHLKFWTQRFVCEQCWHWWKWQFNNILFHIDSSQIVKTISKNDYLKPHVERKCWWSERKQTHDDSSSPLHTVSFELSWAEFSQVVGVRLLLFFSCYCRSCFECWDSMLFIIGILCILVLGFLHSFALIISVEQWIWKSFSKPQNSIVSGRVFFFSIRQRRRFKRARVQIYSESVQLIASWCLISDESLVIFKNNIKDHCSALTIEFIIYYSIKLLVDIYVLNKYNHILCIS